MSVFAPRRLAGCPNRQPPDPSALPQPILLRSRRCRSASKHDMHASILRTCSAQTPIQTRFVPVRTCGTGPLKWASGQPVIATVGYFFSTPLAMSHSNGAGSSWFTKLVRIHKYTCARRHARAKSMRVASRGSGIHTCVEHLQRYACMWQQGCGERTSAPH